MRTKGNGQLHSGDKLTEHGQWGKSVEEHRTGNQMLWVRSPHNSFRLLNKSLKFYDPIPLSAKLRSRTRWSLVSFQNTISLSVEQDVHVIQLPSCPVTFLSIYRTRVRVLSLMDAVGSKLFHIPPKDRWSLFPLHLNLRWSLVALTSGLWQNYAMKDSRLGFKRTGISTLVSWSCELPCKKSSHPTRKTMWRDPEIAWRGRAASWELPSRHPTKVLGTWVNPSWTLQNKPALPVDITWSRKKFIQLSPAKITGPQNNEM